MKITICGSIAFYEEMIKAKEKLESLGHEVKLPPHEIQDDSGKMIPVIDYYKKRKEASEDNSWIWDTKEIAMRNHFDKVVWADSILVLNSDKNNIKGYIGGNTLLEMGLAMHLRKKIYLLNEIPEISYKEEILAMKPLVLDGELGKI